MGKKLTDPTISELITPAENDDFIYLVDVDDTTDDPTGTSVRQKTSNFLRGRTFGKSGTETIIFNMSGSADHPGNSGLASDWVIYMSNTTNKLIIGIALQDVSAFPADLNNVAKFAKFYEGDKLIP